MYGRGERQHIPDVDDREFGRLGPIASREPPASSTRDYVEAAGAPFDRKGHLLDDVRERAGDFGEWRMDYSRELARRKEDTRQAEDQLRHEWSAHQREQAELERRVANWSRENGFDEASFPGPAMATSSASRASNALPTQQQGSARPPQPTAPKPVKTGITGVDRWELQELLVGRNRIPTCQLELGPNPPEVAWQSARCVRVEPPMADFAIVNAESVRNAVGIILRGNTGSSIIDQIIRVQKAGAIGVAIINTSSEKFNPDVVEQELAPEASGVMIPVVVIRDIDGETIPRRATVSVLNSGRGRRARSTAQLPEVEQGQDDEQAQLQARSLGAVTSQPGAIARETLAHPRNRGEPTVQPAGSPGSSPVLDREGVRDMALKLGRRLEEFDLDRAMSEMGGRAEVPYDTFCQWWAEETVRARHAAIETDQNAPQSPPPPKGMRSHTATHERISKEMSMTHSSSPTRPRAASPPPQQSQQADGSAVQAALIQAGIDAETSMQVLRGLERSGKIRPGSSPRRVRQQQPAAAAPEDQDWVEAAEGQGDWATASDEDHQPPRQKKSVRATKSTGAARRLRKVQGVKSAVSRRTHRPTSSYVPATSQARSHELSATTAFDQLMRDQTTTVSHSPYSPPRGTRVQDHFLQQSMLPQTEYPSEHAGRDATPDSFRELSTRYAEDRDADGQYSGYPPGYTADSAPRNPTQNKSYQADRAQSPPLDSSRRHRSRRKDKREHRRHKSAHGGDEQGDVRSRGRRHADRSKGKSQRHRSSRRAARHVTTDSSTVRSPLDQLAPPYSDDDAGYSPVASEKQDPRVLQQVDELCQSIPTFSGMTAHERKLMVEVLQPFTAEPGTRFISQGDEGDAMYILAVGECKASITTGQYEREVKRYQPGDYFGELALMDNAPRAANVDAVTDITCLRISAREFHRVLGGTAAYTSMERNAAKDRAIQAEIMAQLAGSAQPQPTAPPPGPVSTPAEAVVQAPMPARPAMSAQAPAYAPAAASVPVSAAPSSLPPLPAAMPPATMPPAPAPAAYQPPAVPSTPAQSTAALSSMTLMIDGQETTVDEYLSIMGRKLVTAIRNAAHDAEGRVITDSSITYLIEKFVSQVPLFMVMDPEERSGLSNVMEPVQFLQGDEIIKQGDVGDCLYILAMGKAYVTITFQPGQRPKRVGKDYKPGDAFGELALLGGPTATRKAGIVAEEASICLRIDRENFNIFFANCEPAMEWLREQAAKY